jgi:hypothetical protein
MPEEIKTTELTETQQIDQKINELIAKEEEAPKASATTAPPASQEDKPAVADPDKPTEPAPETKPDATLLAGIYKTPEDR